LVLIIGIVATAYVFPPFYRSMMSALRTDRGYVNATWPPDMIRQFQYEAEEVYREFYTWTIFLILSFLFLIPGIYLTLKPDRRERKTVKRTGR